MILEIIFWICIIYLAYVEVGYLLLLSLCPRKKLKFKIKQDFQPFVTILFAAHNEQAVIRRKLDNTLNQDYPSNLVQVIVASDSSTDQTDQIVQEYSERGVRLCRTPQHGGKIAALRAAEASITGQVVVFTDADAFLEPEVISKLVRHFDDPKVGAVSGREIRPSIRGTGGGKGEGLYNRIETQVKLLEGKIGNQVLLHGGVFAMRRELLPYVPDHLTHDGIVPAKLTMEGYDTLYEPEAVSVEAYNLDTRQDWKRRIRTVMQAFQSYLYVKEALNPMRTGFYAVQILSHRMLRWFVFPVMILALISNLILVTHSLIYLGIAILQVGCYCLAGTGYWLDRAGKRPSVFYFPFYFLYIHIAAFYAIILTFTGKRFTTWRPTQRQVE